MTCLVTVVTGDITQVLYRRSVSTTSLISLRLPRGRASLPFLLMGVALTPYYYLGSKTATLS
jgi:hypothetical protein